MIDWRAAQRIGELIAGSPPRGGIRAEKIEPLAYDFARKVSAYSGLELHGELPPLETVDRSAWIAANLKTMRPLLAPLTERLEKENEKGSSTGGLFAAPLRAAAGPLRSASGLMLGAQVGALTGMLSQRVLGQYDLALLDASVQPRLLLLAPNLAQAARTLGVDRDELVLWVTIHEITHAVQFSGAPWLREYLGGIVKELVEGLQVSVASDDSQKDGNGSSLSGWLSKLTPKGGLSFDPSELRDMVERARRGQLLRLTLGEDRWALVERMQAAMSLIEGHAEHTMDVVGAETLPSLEKLRKAMNRRRTQRGLPWKVLERLLGLEMKMRQYEIGRRFCDAVVREGGPETLALAWSGPQALPSTAELERPSDWIARIRREPLALPSRTHVPPVTN
jgi:coenzyme F420 biosynthesis associated uncharacterized protein